MGTQVKPFMTPSSRINQIAPVPIAVGGTVSIATTGNTDILLMIPRKLKLIEAKYVGATALTANDTNYLTFSITNITNSNAAMLAATDANTTKSTGGTGLSANTVRSLTLSTTDANLKVSENDVLRIRFAASGTLAGAISNAAVILKFSEDLV